MVSKIKPIDERVGGIGGLEAFDPDEQNAAVAEGTQRNAQGDEVEGIGPVAVRGKLKGKGQRVVVEDSQEDGEGLAASPRVGAESEEDDADDMPGAPHVFDEAALREKIAKLPLRFASTERRAATEDDLRDVQNVTEMEGYRFPGLDLLEEPEKNFSSRLESLVREQAQALESALQQYRINGEVTDIESGPVITLYHVRMAPGTKVAQLSAVASDIARALKAVNIRIVPNIPGRDTVGVEVPNPTKERVRLKELMSNTERYSDMKLPMFLGKDASGEPLIGDLTTMPHMLIAGTTGSGKSVCMNTIIISFLYTRKPSELKLVLVDPKMVEMSQFKDIPHLMCPVVTEMAKAAAILEWACRKMDERYELLAEAGCRDIAAYNEMSWDELRDAFKPATEREEALIPRKLPYMVFVIDELADLMMTNKEVEGSIIRIAQKARAVGIHMILATQRPQANVVTGLIKSNMPCRIAFKVASGMDSRIVLDQKGGELLLGQGDMLFLSPRTSKLVRAQGTLVDDKEIRRVVRFMRDVATPTFERQLIQLRTGDADEERIVESKNNSSASLAAAQEDPMFDRAVEIVLESKRGSVSLLQRRLAIGYTRASRLIDLMGIAGIIGEHKGSVAREVVITLEDWETMKRLAEAEAKRLGITNSLFDGGSGSGGERVDARGAATDLDDMDAVGDRQLGGKALGGEVDLDMGGVSADGAGPLIGGRAGGESERMELDAEDDEPRPPGRRGPEAPPFDVPGETAEAKSKTNAEVAGQTRRDAEGKQAGRAVRADRAGEVMSVARTEAMSGGRIAAAVAEEDDPEERAEPAEGEDGEDHAGEIEGEEGVEVQAKTDAKIDGSGQDKSEENDHEAVAQADDEGEDEPEQVDEAEGEEDSEEADDDEYEYEYEYVEVEEDEEAEEQVEQPAPPEAMVREKGGAKEDAKRRKAG